MKTWTESINFEVLVGCSCLSLLCRLHFSSSSHQYYVFMCQTSNLLTSNTSCCMYYKQYISLRIFDHMIDRYITTYWQIFNVLSSCTLTQPFMIWSLKTTRKLEERCVQLSLFWSPKNTLISASSEGLICFGSSMLHFFISTDCSSSITRLFLLEDSLWSMIGLG